MERGTVADYYWITDQFTESTLDGERKCPFVQPAAARFNITFNNTTSIHIHAWMYIEHFKFSKQFSSLHLNFSHLVRYQKHMKLLLYREHHYSSL